MMMLACLKSPSRCWIKDYMEISDKDVSDFLDNFMSKNYSDCTQKKKSLQDSVST